MSRRLRKTKDGCCFNDNEALLNLAIIELRTDATREAFVVANDAAITFPKEEESRNEEEEEDMREGERVTKVSLRVDVVYKLQKRTLASSDSHAEQFILKFSLFHSLSFPFSRGAVTRRTCPSNTKPTRRRTRRIRCSPPRSFPTS